MCAYCLFGCTSEANSAGLERDPSAPVLETLTTTRTQPAPQHSCVGLQASNLLAAVDRGTARAPEVITLFESLDSADNTMMRIGTWNRFPPFGRPEMPEISSRDHAGVATSCAPNNSLQVEEKLLQPPMHNGSEPKLETPFLKHNVGTSVDVQYDPI